jgi:hypothetical protein
MLSKSQLNRKRLSEFVEEIGDPSELVCDHCLKHNYPCIIMPSSTMKCSSCTKKGIKCVNVSWEALNKTRSETRLQIEKDMEEVEKAHAAMAKAMARISRNRKVLELADKRAKSKAICVLEELEIEEEAERKANGGLSNGEIAEANADLSSLLAGADDSALVDWNALGFSDEIPIASGEPSSNVT